MLTKCLLWLLMTFGFIIHPDYDALPVMVEGKLLAPLINKEFNDGTEAKRIEIVAEDSSLYLIREGFDDKQNCHISRTNLVPAEIAGLQTYMMPVGGITETCTGVGCTFCGFKKGGGCECKNVSGYCTHTISRNWLTLNFSPARLLSL